MHKEFSRREFLVRSSCTLGAVGTAAGLGTLAGPAVMGSETSARNTGPLPTTRDIREYLLQHSPWVDRDQTVDTVKCGDPERPVKRAGVAWFPSLWDIQAAIRDRL